MIAANVVALWRVLIAGNLLAPQKHFDFQHQFFDAEGLGNVVVCAEFEALDAVLLQRFGRQKQQGYLVVARADVAGELEAVDAGQHHIEQAEVVPPLFEGPHRRLAIGEKRYFVALQFEVVLCDEAQAFVVFDVEQVCFHGLTIALSVRCRLPIGSAIRMAVPVPASLCKSSRQPWAWQICLT